jgi:hypothetical protein
VNIAPGISLVPVVFVVVAIMAGWALFTHRRRLGLVLTMVGLALLAYAVWWTFTAG